MIGAERTLVIVDGSVGSGVGCASVLEAYALAGGASSAGFGHPLAWIPAGLSGAGKAAAERQAAPFGAWVRRAEADGDEPAALMLLRAVLAAGSEGCPAVLWCASAGGASVRVEDVARILDLATLAGRLGSVELGPPRVRVMTPYADLNAAQLADVARDLSVV